MYSGPFPILRESHSVFFQIAYGAGIAVIDGQPDTPFRILTDEAESAQIPISVLQIDTGEDPPGSAIVIDGVQQSGNIAYGAVAAAAPVAVNFHLPNPDGI